MVDSYYDQLAPYYKYIYADWENSLKIQATALDQVIKEHFGNKVTTILDTACGIGTQSIGLAELGYQVKGSDISPRAIQIAREETSARGLVIDYSVRDMRQVAELIPQEFDILLACDNAVPHILSEEEILNTFISFYQVTKTGGGILISVRDYLDMKREQVETRFVPRNVHLTEKGRIILFDIWKFEGDIYQIKTYVVEESGENELNTIAVSGGKYYCITIPVLEKLFFAAGFETVTTLRDVFFQPLIVAKK